VTLIGVDTDNEREIMQAANKVTKWSLRAVDRLPESRYVSHVRVQYSHNRLASVGGRSMARRRFTASFKPGTQNGQRAPPLRLKLNLIFPLTRYLFLVAPPRLPSCPSSPLLFASCPKLTTTTAFVAPSAGSAYVRAAFANET